MKFEVGDKVRVRKDSRFSHGRLASMEGIVKEVRKGISYPYLVRFPSNGDTRLHANELELYERPLSEPMDDTDEPQYSSEAEEVSAYIYSRLNIGISEMLEEFTMDVYKLGHRDGQEFAKETVNDWYQPKPY